MRDLTNLRFRHFAQRRERAPKLWLPQTKQKVRLIFARIDSFTKHGVWSRCALAASGRGRPDSMLDNRVMTRGDVIAAERFGLTPEIAELEFLVAHHAWIRRSTGLVLAGEIINHEPLELVGFIDNVMRNAEGIRHAARISDCLRAATFVLCTRDAVLRPDFHGDADDFVALLAQQISGNAGVYSTAHPKKNTLPFPAHSNAEFRLMAN